jgi:hypothetical protein
MEIEDHVMGIGIPFMTTAPVAAGGGQPALAAGTRYNELIQGRITGMMPPNFSITNIAGGLADIGLPYDGSGFDVSVTSISVEFISEPASLVMLSLGLTAVAVVTWLRHKARLAA